MTRRDKAKVFSLKNAFYDFARLTGIPLGLVAYRPKWIYTSKKAKQFHKGGVLVICNHVTYVDPLYIQFAIPERRHRVVALQDMFNTKGGFFLKWFRALPIDRENNALNPFKDIIQALKDGYCVSMFPEGHMNETGEKELDPFKSGMVLIAMKAGVPIVPVYIKRRKSPLERLVIVVGEPVEVKKNMTVREMNEVTKQLQEKEEEMIKLCNKGKENENTKQRGF